VFRAFSVALGPARLHSALGGIRTFMKTAIWILTLIGTAPVLLLAVLLLAMHIIAAIVGPRHGHHDFIISVMRSNSSYVMSIQPWPLLVILAGGSLFLFGVWKLLQH
jgi:hypothetical protein